MIKFLPVFLFFVFAPLLGQNVEGTITDKNGEPVSFANVYVPALKTGTTSNYEGEYQLSLPSGTHVLHFQYLGYQTVQKMVQVSSSNVTLDVRLQERNYTLPELKVLSSGEDPAYYIMRHAVAMAPYYQNQVSEYDCRVYLKGTGVFTKIPRLLKKQFEKEGLEKDKPFVMETVSDIQFKLPNEVKQEVVAMRSSGNDNNTSPMYMITSNLYNARDYDMIGPVDAQALSVYRFKLEGSFQDGGRTINKIKVTPKRKGQDVFEGYIYIADDFWNIHSADLKMDIPMATANMHQLYAPVDENVWMPVSLDFDIEFKALGVEMNYKYVASIAEYHTTINPKLDHTFLATAQIAQQAVLNEMRTPETKEDTVLSKAQEKIASLKDKPELNNREAKQLQRLVDKEVKRELPPEPLEIKDDVISSNKDIINDSSYWSGIRPIPLSENEEESFTSKDSMLLVMKTPEYQDSVREARRRFKLKHLAFGNTYNYSADSVKTRRYFSQPGFINLMGITFNTVDGLRLDYPLSYTYSDTTGKYFSIRPYVGYAFARNTLDASVSAYYRFNGLNQSWVALKGGQNTVDFNQKYGMPKLLNTDYTLFYQKNFLKFFSKRFVDIGYGRELLNGLQLNTYVGIANRRPLTNNTDFTFIDYGRTFTANTPENSVIEDWMLEESNITKASISLAYTPRHRYRIRDGVKRHVDSRYPTFSVLYQGAFDLGLRNSARYDYLQAAVEQSIPVGLMDEISYQFKAGAFTNYDRTYFTDFKHFNTNEVELTLTPTLNLFRHLPYYQASVNNWFLEGHAEYQAQRLLLKRLPFLANTLITENIQFSYLHNSNFNHYTEMGYGLRNIFLLLNFEVNTSFIGNTHYLTGFKIGMNLN